MTSSSAFIYGIVMYFRVVHFDFRFSDLRVLPRLLYIYRRTKVVWLVGDSTIPHFRSIADGLEFHPQLRLEQFLFTFDGFTIFGHRSSLADVLSC